MHVLNIIFPTANKIVCIQAFSNMAVTLTSQPAKRNLQSISLHSKWRYVQKYCHKILLHYDIVTLPFDLQNTIGHRNS